MGCLIIISLNFVKNTNDRRKFRSQTSDNMDRWKAEQGRGREKRKIRREKSRREKSQKKEDADARKGRKVAKHCFSNDLGLRRSTSRLAKAAGAEPAGQMRDEKLHAVVARSTFPSQNLQNTSASTFGSCDVEKVHAALARSTFPSQNVQNASASDHFWKLRCRKSARRCGAKHISKSKCAKRLIVGPLLEVAMSKKCPPLWREAHFKVKMYKTPQRRTTFGSCDVEKVNAVVARSKFWSQNVQNTRGFRPLLEDPSLDSLCHPWFTTTNLSYRFPIFETSATALCGTTGNIRNNQSMKLEIIDAIKNEWWFQHIPTIKKVWTCWMELNSHEKNG